MTERLMTFNADRLIFAVRGDGFAVHFWLRNALDPESLRDYHGGIVSHRAGGRCSVEFADGAIRNLKPEHME